MQMLFINESKREKESVNQLTVILKMIVDTTVPHKLILPRQGQWMCCASVWTVRCMQVISFLLLFLVSVQFSD